MGLVKIIEDGHVQKNADGHLGKVCNNCGGYGYTLAFEGSKGCYHCNQTGVAAPTNAELQGEIERLKNLLGISWGGTGTVMSVRNSRQFWAEMIAWATSSGTAVANTTTETIIFPNITIPANYMQDGRALRLRLFGQYSTTATPTLIFGHRWGGVAGTLLSKTAAVTLPTVTAGGFEIMIMDQTRTNGATGTIMSNGHAMVFAGVAPTVASATGNAAVTPLMNGGTITPAAVTVDLTADTAMSTTATWSAASASNTLTGLNLELDSKN